MNSGEENSPAGNLCTNTSPTSKPSALTRHTSFGQNSLSICFPQVNVTESQSANSIRFKYSFVPLSIRQLNQRLFRVSVPSWENTAWCSCRVFHAVLGCFACVRMSVCLSPMCVLCVHCMCILREIGVFYKLRSVLRKCSCGVFIKSCLNFLCGTFYNLFNEQLRDTLKFVFSPNVILSGWLCSMHQLYVHMQTSVRMCVYMCVSMCVHSLSLSFSLSLSLSLSLSVCLLIYRSLVCS